LKPHTLCTMLMKIKPFVALLCVCAMTTMLHAQNPQKKFTPPATQAQPVTYNLHGTLLTDPYEWLEDKTKPEVVSWTRSQHDATIEYLNKHCPPIPGLKEEIIAYINRDIESAPTLIADRQFLTIKKQGEKQSKLYTRLNGKNLLLFDPEKIDPSGKSSITGIAYTENAAVAGIGLQNKGAEISTYYIIDTKTGKQLFQPIEGLRGFSFTKDGKHAYITVGTKEMLEKQIPLKTYLHKLGADRSTDKFLIASADAKNFASVYDARYSDLTFISEGDFYATHSLKMRKAGTEEAAVEIYSSRKYQARPNAIGDKIYFYTNHEAPNYKIMIADKANPKFEQWKTLIAERKDVVISGFEILDDKIAVLEKKDVITAAMLYDMQGNFIRKIETPEFGNISSLYMHRESGTVFMTLSTFTSPTKIFKSNVKDLQNWELFYQAKVPVNTEQIQGKIVFYPSKDGVKVPLFIIHKKGIELNGQNPTLLYGYGGFQIGISPSFVGLNASFINRGGVYAIAGIRGGDEYGEQWHLDGMMYKKQNCFDDFIAAAEYLIAEKYTQREKLAIYGGSNGGLLIGAMLTQRPDLYKAAVCAVPLLDMVRFHKFLIARYWIPEYGDPDKAEDFYNILQYSPYHNIRVGVNMPTTMVTAGENDTRVDPLHAKKFVAAVQNNIGQVNPFMLYMDYDSGHGSGKSTEQAITQQDYFWRFIMNELGMR